MRLGIPRPKPNPRNSAAESVVLRPRRAPVNAVALAERRSAAEAARLESLFPGNRADERPLDLARVGGGAEQGDGFALVGLARASDRHPGCGLGLDLAVERAVKRVTAVPELLGSGNRDGVTGHRLVDG